MAWIADLPRQNQSNIDYNDHWYRQRLRSLQAVDEMVEAVVKRLEYYGILDDTYIFYSTDNGFHIGQHRLQPSKQCPYQEDVNIPMIVRGPGVAVNRVTDIITTHTDLTPTFLSLAGAPLAGVKALDDFDGAVMPITSSEVDQVEKDRSFAEHIGIENWGFIMAEGKHQQTRYHDSSYKSVRIIGVNDDYHYVYNVWCGGGHELYDVIVSPDATHSGPFHRCGKKADLNC